MTRKPQIAWGLRIKTSRKLYIYPPSIRWRRKDARADFWRDRETYTPAARAIIEQRLKDDTFRLVKVQIIPVEGEDG